MARTLSSFAPRTRPVSVAAPHWSSTISGHPCWARWVRLARSRGLQDGGADLHVVAGTQHDGRGEAHAVHIRAVGRAEVLDVDRSFALEDPRVEGGRERVV